MTKPNYVDIIYSEDRHKSDYPQKLAKHLAENRKVWAFDYGGRVLDIGCGDRRFSDALNDYFNVWGVDGCEMNETGDHNYDRRFEQHDLTIAPYPYEDNSFDIVFTKSVIEHLHDPKVLMDEAYRILKPGGTLVCLTPSWKHHKDEAFYADYTHVTPFTRRSLFMIAKLSYFVNIDCDYFYQLPKLWKNSWLIVGVKLLQFLNLPYRPFYNVPWPEEINKMLQFSKEAMLLCVAKKPL